MNEPTLIVPPSVQPQPPAMPHWFGYVVAAPFALASALSLVWLVFAVMSGTWDAMFWSFVGWAFFGGCARALRRAF